ncbi:uncharacterized protein LOC129219422 [Uloborus diversus]|uniref:uncharacterized protein LOC129219422 n=1 Tax=Uloborus diversus TaxID=327109 RepID=UPI00240A0EFA|nr:uncharacterized protein LOC129219422 [Uloborus diversus]
MLCIIYSQIFFAAFTVGSGYERKSYSDNWLHDSYLNPETENYQMDPRIKEDFNALYDYHGYLRLNKNPNIEDIFYEDDGRQFHGHLKKSDSRPKYDPGWKFIGLGKRPHRKDRIYSYSIDSTGSDINPLLGISTLVNLEFFNAIKDGIADAKEAIKKEDAMRRYSSISDGHTDGYRIGNKHTFLGGRQKPMYDPGWMLTGLGK